MILTDDTCSTRRKKYGGSFANSLEVSQELVNNIAAQMSQAGFIIRAQDDAVPFRLPNGKYIRLIDIQTYYSGIAWPIEAKDFCRLVRYEATGLPRSYVDEKLSKVDDGNLILLLCDNMVYVEEKAKRDRVSKEEVLKRLEAKGLAKRGLAGWEFVPYGNKLSTLMSKHVDPVLSERIKCGFASYKGQKQYIWRMEGMHPLPKIIEAIKNSSK
jgi:hypothetical protein